MPSLTQAQAGPAASLAELEEQCSRCASLFASSTAAFPPAVSLLLSELEELRMRLAASARRAADSKVKEFDATMDAWRVTAEQLDAAAALCEDLLSVEDARAGQRAEELVYCGLAATLGDGCAHDPALPSSPFLSLPTAHVCADAVARDAGRLRVCVDPLHSTVTGDHSSAGASAYSGMAGSLSLTCVDDAGEAVPWLLPQDVSVCVSGGEVVRRVMSAPGVCQADFVAPFAPSVHVQVSVLGVPWPPATVSMTCAAMGRYCSTIDLETVSSNLGLAVTRDSRNVIVSNGPTARLYVYAWPGGALLRSFGGKGAGPGQFSNPMGLAVTHRDTILVAETWNERVQVCVWWWEG